MANSRKPDRAEAEIIHSGIATGAEPVAEALRRKIATLQEQQKDAIHRLSIQRISIQDVGMELARLEDELATAQKLLQRRLNADHLTSIVHETAAGGGQRGTMVK